MPVSIKKTYTSEDYWNLPEGERAELIGGKFYAMAPSSRKMDYSVKNTLYSEAGVREYWIVDPAKERTTVYHYEEDAAPVIFAFNQPIAAGIYRDFEITIADLLI